MIAHHAPVTRNADARDVTFVGWNVHVGNGDVRRLVRDLRSGRHTPGRPIGQLVLLLQEAVRTANVPAMGTDADGARRIGPRDVHLADIETIARDLNLSLVYIPSMRNGRAADAPEDRGSAILSSLPLSDVSAVELPGERHRRVAIFARTGGLGVGTIHLDALGGPQRLWLFWTPWMRRVQARALAAAMPDGPLVLSADLNTWHGIDELAVRSLGQTPGMAPPKGKPPLRLRTLDFMFFRLGPTASVRYVRLADSYGSDHRPLVGWIDQL